MRKKRKKVFRIQKKARKRKQVANEKLEPKLQSRRIKIKVIGIGGGGSSIVSEIAPKLKKIRFVAANTDSQALKAAGRTAERFQFGQSLTGGLGTGMDAQLGETAALNEKDKIKRIFQGEDLSILVSTLGGGVGSGASPVFAKIARGSRNLTLGIFTLPFDFEGKKRREIAQTALEKARPELNTLVIIPNDKIFQIIDPKTPLKEALSAMNKVLTESLQGLIEMIYLPGLINIDFADLKAALEGRARLAYLTTVEVQGNNRTEEGIKKIIHSPFYEYGISGAERILFNITGSKQLTLNEVEKISKSISSFNPRAKIIFGLSQREDYHDKIKIALLAVGCKERGEVKQKVRREKKKKKTANEGKSPATKKLKKKDREKSIKIDFKNQKDAESEKNARISRTALDLRKDLDKAEKEIASKESELDVPAFLRKKKMRFRLR